MDKLNTKRLICAICISSLSSVVYHYSVHLGNLLLILFWITLNPSDYTKKHYLRDIIKSRTVIIDAINVISLLLIIFMIAEEFPSGLITAFVQKWYFLLALWFFLNSTALNKYLKQN